MARGPKVYVLRHPETFEIRYVGKTIQELKDRLENHLDEARTKKNLYVLNWIREVFNEGLKPRIDLLEECETEKESLYRERYWELTMRACGVRLTNTAECGGQPPSKKGTKQSPERIEQRVSQIRGKPVETSRREREAKKVVTEGSSRKGRTNIEIYGPEKAEEIRLKISKPKTKEATEKNRQIAIQTGRKPVGHYDLSEDARARKVLHIGESKYRPAFCPFCNYEYTIGTLAALRRLKRSCVQCGQIIPSKEELNARNKAAGR